MPLGTGDKNAPCAAIATFRHVNRGWAPVSVSLAGGGQHVTGTATAIWNTATVTLTAGTVCACLGIRASTVTCPVMLGSMVAGVNSGKVNQ